MYSRSAMNPTLGSRRTSHGFELGFVVAGFELVSGQAADAIAGGSSCIMVTERVGRLRLEWSSFRV